MRKLAGCLALTALLLPAGCMGGDEETTLFPDGSGKIRIRVTLPKMTVAKLEQGLRPGNPDPTPFVWLVMDQDPLEVEKQAEGVVAWRIENRVEDAEGLHRVKVAYFEDINKVRLFRERGKKEPSFSARYERAANGGRLAVTDEFRALLKDTDLKGPPLDEKGRELFEDVAKLSRELKFSFSFTVPGPIVEASGWTETKDRTARLALDGGTLVDMLARPDREEAKKVKAAVEPKEGTISWKETRVTAAEVDAFRKELADAKTAWATTLDEARRKKNPK